MTEQLTKQLTKHYSEAELLETYYTQPGQSMPAMMHLAACGDCAARYERLERKLRSLASCQTEKPQTFWTRQRMLIMRGIEAKKASTQPAPRPWRVAAAAVLAFFLGGVVVYETVPALKAPPVTSSATPQPRSPATTTDDSAVAQDAWHSEELKDFHGIVQWETWVDPTSNPKGSSL